MSAVLLSLVEYIQHKISLDGNIISRSIALQLVCLQITTLDKSLATSLASVRSFPSVGHRVLL